MIKNKFLYLLAHIFNNPFNLFWDYQNFVSENYESHSPEEIRKFFSLINTSSNHVYNLLDNLLEWARAQSGSIEKVPVVFFISEPINECLNLLGHSIDSKHIKIIKEIPDDFQVFADKT
jgi:signal transduction histidine kinase